MNFRTKDMLESPVRCRVYTSQSWPPIIKPSFANADKHSIKRTESWKNFLFLLIYFWILHSFLTLSFCILTKAHPCEKRLLCFSADCLLITLAPPIVSILTHHNTTLCKLVALVFMTMPSVAVPQISSALNDATGLMYLRSKHSGKIWLSLEPSLLLNWNM